MDSREEGRCRDPLRPRKGESRSGDIENHDAWKYGQVSRKIQPNAKCLIVRRIPIRPANTRVSTQPAMLPTELPVKLL
jgi:hypothetical protein